MRKPIVPKFNCKLSAAAKVLTHSWEHTVGSDHAPMALRADWRGQLVRCHRELGFRHVRFHALLSDQMGTLICQDEKLIYSFFNADQIVDFLLSIGMKPFVEFSFMPDVLASGRSTVFRYRGNVTPPKDYSKWAALIEKLVRHWVERYGVKEVGQWFFEVWNEPNLEMFWAGTRADYFQLYRYAVEAIKGVDSSLQVGGPATAQNAWVPEFLDFCQQHSVPADFVSTHYYLTDALVNTGADTISQVVNVSHRVMQDEAQKTRDRSRELPVYYTEWNLSSNSRDPFHDTPMAAALVVNVVMGVQDLVQGYSFWTFSDIFEEDYLPSVPFHGGFGLLNLHGIAKPTYRAFELLHRMGSELLPVSGTHETVSAWVTRRETTVTVLLTNHAMPHDSIATETAHVRLTDACQPRASYVERIDHEHADSGALWSAMGEPPYLSGTQVELLHVASNMMKEPYPVTFDSRAIQFDVTLPPQSVAVITIECANVEEGR